MDAPRLACLSACSKIVILPKGILNCSKRGTPKKISQVISSAFGKYHFDDVLLDVSKTKASRPFLIYISFCTCTIDEGYILVEEQVIQQFHAFMEIFWESDSSIVCFIFPGQVSHSSHVLPYKHKHVHGKQKKM